jgi:hypothetical protein
MSFLTPFFFAGLATILVPILIHLVRRARAPRIEFPSLMFVRRVPQRTVRRKRLQNLLLLLLRCLALALLVLAFVRPYVSWGAGQSRPEGRSVVMLLDRSFSMRAEDGKEGRSRFAQAVEEALAEVDRLGGEDELSLVVFDEEVEVHAPAKRATERNLADLKDDRATVRQVLRGLAPGDRGTDLHGAIRSAETLLRESVAERRQIILLTDLQETSLRDVERLAPLAPGIELLPRIVGGPAVSNVGVSGISGTGPLYQTRYTDPLRVRLTNYGAEAIEQVKVGFLLNGQLVEERRLPLQGRETATLTLTGFNLIPGINRCVIEVEAPGDRLERDNRFHFTLRRAVPIEALIIETATRGRSESFYLRYALTTGENLPFQVTVRPAGTIDPATLSRYGLVIVNDAQVSPALAKELSRAVEAGAGLIIAAGPHTEDPLFGSSWGEEPPARRLRTVISRGETLTMGGGLRRDHPIFDLFGDGSPLASGQIFGYHRLVPRADGSILARFDGGDPALVEWRLGAGRLLLFATTLDATWNDLPLRPVYLPLVRQMTRYLVERDEPSWHPVGAEITFPLEESDVRDGLGPQVEQPDGQRLRQVSRTPEGDLRMRPLVAGLYQVRSGTRTTPLAVNVEPLESDLRQMEVAQLLTPLTRRDGEGVTIEASGPASPLPAEPAELEARQQLWLYLLAAALLLFLSEGVVARRIRMARLLS